MPRVEHDCSLLVALWPAWADNSLPCALPLTKPATVVGSHPPSEARNLSWTVGLLDGSVSHITVVVGKLGEPVDVQVLPWVSTYTCRSVEAWGKTSAATADVLIAMHAALQHMQN
jgi:hypothetical protein